MHGAKAGHSWVGNSKLNNYFNKSCLTPNFPIIGNDGWELRLGIAASAL